MGPYLKSIVPMHYSVVAAYVGNGKLQQPE